MVSDLDCRVDIWICLGLGCLGLFSLLGCCCVDFVCLVLLGLLWVCRCALYLSSLLVWTEVCGVWLQLVFDWLQILWSWVRSVLICSLFLVCG